MKATTIIATFLFGTTMAAPGAISLKRSFIEADTGVDGGGATVADTLTACVECPCNGFYGGCTCVVNGCCLQKNCTWPRS
ncbi:uncharacterized protein J4E79_001523 [Alternaria viburni]|uniref:uncharacterized protein n=1 Tax=Alternaria viburni TaxID=566460 RepID=UPI0020C54140|nr:uncharacterized protein J4E79_001523 [Alternaria viburni]KAI4669479.1 hypothetical protein J4E79_001523 [Alternaria viburni]